MLAVFGIGYGFIETALGATKRTGPDVQPSAIKASHRDTKAFAFVANAVFNRNADIVEIHLSGGLRMPAELLLVGAETDALHVFFDDKAGNALCAIIGCARHGDIYLVLAAAGNELLRTIDDIIITITDRLGLQ